MMTTDNNKKRDERKEGKKEEQTKCNMNSIVDTSGPCGQTGEDEVAELGSGFGFSQVQSKSIAEIVNVRETLKFWNPCGKHLWRTKQKKSEDER